ncbi:hypothetical protein GWI33_009877 [Rhynchophorus ferrugineus]|uniref:Uncharacterized protein n=1 Tax=Rhynchophorus ferrugineus TaxID=354439 RepID=A0A834MC88_RHYFE|nr:hypothetical protein GWI33_010451 [Rhynchophorus ferrugineus]KAF7276732.1 hypothetical protein GWI33_009877 [Rhynchophorus ferrugineus]
MSTTRENKCKRSPRSIRCPSASIFKEVAYRAAESNRSTSSPRLITASVIAEPLSVGRTPLSHPLVDRVPTRAEVCDGTRADVSAVTDRPVLELRGIRSAVVRNQVRAI